MGLFVLSGKRKIPLNLNRFSSVQMLTPEHAPERVPWSALRASLKRFFSKNGPRFAGKKVGVVIPDPTRDFHPRQVLQPLAKALEALSPRVEFIIALGLHRRLTPQELADFLGPRFVRENRILQHTLSAVRRLGTASGVPVTVYRGLFSYDLLVTVSVVEPHLYAGFSGGVKGIAIGLAGKETILKTHAVPYLSQKSVRAGNIRTNPFQRFLWEAVDELNRPILSLNIVNNAQKQLAGYAVGEARRSFHDAVRLARWVFACKVSGQYDLLLIGSDHPKDQSLYQSSRLFNYVLEGKRLVRRSGAIVVFAGLGGHGKSQAERNFEGVLRKHSLPASYTFGKPGEHRAFKVLEAARTARLCLFTPNPPKGRLPSLTVLPDQRSLRRWIAEQYGPAPRIGVIPAGFSFLATR
jgi:nickel-dependent lactate racemase